MPELTTKGLTRTEADTADLYVGYQAAVSTEKEYTSFDTGWGYGPGWYGGGWYGGGGRTPPRGRRRRSTSGRSPSTCIRPAKQLVWRGVASKTLDPKAKPEKQQKNLAKADEEAVQELSAAGEEVIAWRHAQRPLCPANRPEDADIVGVGVRIRRTVSSV